MRATNEINEEESQKYTNPIVSVGIFDDDSLNESFSPKSGKDSKMKKNLTNSITGSMVEMVFDFPIIDSSFNYAGNLEGLKNYLDEIKDECNKRNLHAVFITDYLSVEDLYKLRMSTDIFVHIQTSDAGARSVYEYILCNKKIVHGSWICYKSLESFKPLFYFPVDKSWERG